MQRTQAALVLILSVAVAIGVVVHAFSLEEWGDAGGIVFPLVFITALAIAVTSAVRMTRASKEEK